MATFTNRELVKQVMSNGGFPGEPRAHSVYEYDADNGKAMWAVFWNHAIDMLDKPYIVNPRQLWNKEAGLTLAGEKFLADDS